MSFAGRTVLVTGASRGLGAAVAVAFAARGAWVALGHRVQAAKAEDVLRRVREAGGDGRCVAFDVRDRDAVGRAVDAIERERGGIDVLVNNAGLTRAAWFAADDAAAWDEVIDVNLVGSANCSRAVVRGMIAHGKGAIVNVASVAAVRSLPAQTAYGASKAGLLGFTRALAAELAGRGVRVNAVVPGLLDTGMATRMPRDAAEKMIEHVPMGRVGTADEVCQAVLFLASDEASYVTGQALAVDGGLSL